MTHCSQNFRGWLLLHFQYNIVISNKNLHTKFKWKIQQITYIHMYIFMVFFLLPYYLHTLFVSFFLYLNVKLLTMFVNKSLGTLMEWNIKKYFYYYNEMVHGDKIKKNYGGFENHLYFIIYYAKYILGQLIIRVIAKKTVIPLVRLYHNLCSCTELKLWKITKNMTCS